MSQSADVGDIDALNQFDVGLMRFADRAKTLLDRLHAETHSARELLDLQRDRLQNAVSYWSDSLSSAEEDDDTSDIESHLCEAEERLSKLESHIAQVEERQGIYEAALTNVRATIMVEVPKARTLLREKRTQLGDYIAVKFADDGTVSAVATENVVSITDSNSKTDVGVATQSAVLPVTQLGGSLNLASYRLPDGFCWFRLDRIALSDMAELPLPDDYPKTSYENMRAGLETLRTEILPLLQSLPPSVAAERFADMDSTSPLPNGIRRRSIWNAFFGRQIPDYVRVEGFRGEFTITNGRHRIAVARDLGWTEIPAEVIEVG